MKGGFAVKTVYFGGDILTLAGTGMPEAILAEDGVIRRLGSAAELCREPGAQLWDLKGKTLLPSFIDPHSHITACAQTLGLADLSKARSFEEICELLREFAQTRQVPEGGWIIGFGYDHNHLAEGRHPDKTLLDQALPGHPVVISNASGHMGVLSSAALNALGVTADTPDPEGGRIGRFPGSREPSGYLEETAFTSITAAVPQPDLETRFKQLSMAEDVYLRCGITTVQDGITRPGEWELLQAAAQKGRLRLDTVCYPDMRLCPQLLTGNPLYRGRYDNRLKIGGYKIFLDGSPQGRTAWMTKPYVGEKDYCGYPIYTDEQVTAFLQGALIEKAQILVHCNGDAACEQLIRCYETALKETGRPSEIRPVMIHAQLVREDQLQRMKKLGMIASFFVAHTWYWGDIHLENFGQERASMISPAKAAQEAGVPYTFHQDTPVIPPNMLETVWCAVNRQTQSGKCLGPGQRITAEEALRAVTGTAAYQYFEEDRKGAIREGMLENLVILSENPLKTDPAHIKDIAVCATIREGEPLYQA